ncbi:MAG: Putative transposase or IS (ACLAME 318) [uncultured Cytophagales bacterium]|uniref:Transposase or IS (ACLAME 318) n=1 Tax=uncultured Cytophagales bacterium TaxID=158755 RepID=A0A6J4IME9_9SPHI|nr:MAG: Putative transposase or IS (ACLAME 318) [uncultured Cytophagales bacterium]
MKLTAQIKLLPTPEQAQALEKTMLLANQACNYLSEVAWEKKTFGQYALHKLAYYACKERFELSSQIIVGCLAKVADAYKLDKQVQPTFKPLGALTYDSRVITFNIAKSLVSIWTLEGRQKIAFVCGERQRQLLQTQQGESDLCLVKGKFLVNATCIVEEPTLEDVKDVLGVDLGIVKLATDSSGESFSGEAVENTRKRYGKLRAALQSCGTKSAKRHLKKLSRKQAKFQADTNHVISKKLVLKAKAQKSALSIESLTGIRKGEKKRLRKTQRAKHSNWAFSQLRLFLTYKAKRYGVELVTIQPQYTSQRCYCCGYIEKANRKSQSHFECVSCGYSNNADINAALNIRLLGLPIVKQPIVSALAG